MKDEILKKCLPTFIKSVEKAKKTKAPVIMSHASFCETKQELLLLGSAVKYACKNGVQIIIIP